MGKLLAKPEEIQELNIPGRFEKFNLSENPFPSEPTVNKDSLDIRNNGGIFEMQIRQREFNLIKERFLEQSQSNINHLRLGYIIDLSYIGRGNGKSAFLINLIQEINKNYSLDLSKGKNKCFAVYVSPSPGGRTKTFVSFVDLIFKSILDSKIIKTCIAILRLKALEKLSPELFASFENEENLVDDLNTEEWFHNNNVTLSEINSEIQKNKFLQNINPIFPLFQISDSLFPNFVRQENFEDFYKFELKRPKEKIDFVFDDLIKLFLAADFNGAYIFVDDFERIPDFQSSRQKRDFAIELRTCLFDGMYTNSKIGFYNYFLILHAGVQRLIQDAWAASGLENRAPISQRSYSNVITFEKLNKDHVTLLLKKYLNTFRLNLDEKNSLFPFDESVVQKMGESTEYNAAKILKMAYELLSAASSRNDIKKIDENYFKGFIENWDGEDIDKIPPIDATSSVDLLVKSQGKQKPK